MPFGFGLPNASGVALGIINLILAAYWYRCAFGGVAIDDDGVVIRNPFRTYHVSWDAAPRFSTSTIPSKAGEDAGSLILLESQGRQALRVKSAIPFVRTDLAQSARIASSLNKMIARAAPGDARHGSSESGIS